MIGAKIRCPTCLVSHTVLPEPPPHTPHPYPIRFRCEVPGCFHQYTILERGRTHIQNMAILPDQLPSWLVKTD